MRNDVEATNVKDAKLSIWKYPLDAWRTGKVVLNLPERAHALTIQVQRGVPCLWALVDVTETRTETRTFAIVGTGEDATHVHDMRADYFTTFQLFGGDLVFHVFEVLSDGGVMPHEAERR